jgi:hypothetical protein
MQPAAEQALPRRRVSQPLDPREAEPNRPWCRRTCRHLDGLASGPGADEAESAADARECAW